MPTIHLSLPESLYEELKRKAEELGVQITDLVKFYIRQGLEERDKEDREEKDDKYEKLEESVAYLEAKVAQLDALVEELVQRLLEKESEEEEVEVISKDEKS
ncbi:MULTISPECIES: hypothetical protein [Sulfolobaceae]|uniref:Uncharacterized protein n=2 Tax=Sulfurisphaera tokodaii TaxID=111955 RepID=F9VN26_SULTO|nr:MULTISPECIES: hypothetical protein [Sulfolobaceae]QIW23400.1 hypothetical protein EWF20_04045 [Sulfolobus sp. S-194]BAK54323.1 hypothetical protein STK_05365 [Sulfurisphaera tokodaii str. 7]HII74768.1 hypothetical protein [Sulfurisphaera tokodaii]